MSVDSHKPKETQEQQPAGAAALPDEMPVAGNGPNGPDEPANEDSDSLQTVAQEETARDCGEPRRRALAFPDLRPYLVDKGGHKAVARGTVIIARWVHGVAAGKSSPAGRPAGKDKPTEPAPGDRKRQGERITADVVLATVFVSGCVTLTAARYLHSVIIFVAVVFLPAAYLVGAWSAEAAGGEAKHRPAPPAPDSARAQDQDNVVDPPDRRGEMGHTDRGEPRAEYHAGAFSEPTEEERQVALYEWVRDMIGKRNGVHLRTLLDDLNREREREGLGEASMAELRAFLEGRGIPVQDQLKVGKHNRSGVRRTDLPEGFTPLLGPDGHAVRLLPRLPPSDLQ
ncbi:hypothetical protein ACIQVO_38690 [Streptomyces sp. NPDC101062]|uniref:hypothetical protein n=1 Tax=unclassified Streptomyces TaxID=2593676 RepID=UPI00382F6BD5